MFRSEAPAPYPAAAGAEAGSGAIPKIRLLSGAHSNAKASAITGPPVGTGAHNEVYKAIVTNRAAFTCHLW